MKKCLFILSMIALMLPTIAFAASYKIDPNSITHLVHNADMNGMEVIVDFAGGGQEKQFWNSGVTGTGWSLNFNNAYDITGTYSLDWNFSSRVGIAGFTINAFPGNIAFDIIENNTAQGNTPGSDNGLWGPNADTWDATAHAISGRSLSGSSTFHVDPDDNTTPLVPYGADFDWVFSNPVYLSTAPNFDDPPNGPHDLFSTLNIDFYNDVNGFTGDFYFTVDTDTVTPVPEPASILLLGFGLLGLAAARRRKI